MLYRDFFLKVSRACQELDTSTEGLPRIPRHQNEGRLEDNFLLLKTLLYMRSTWNPASLPDFCVLVTDHNPKMLECFVNSSMKFAASLSLDIVRIGPSGCGEYVFADMDEHPILDETTLVSIAHVILVSGIMAMPVSMLDHVIRSRRLHYLRGYATWKPALWIVTDVVVPGGPCFSESPSILSLRDFCPGVWLDMSIIDDTDDLEQEFTADIARAVEALRVTNTEHIRAVLNAVKFSSFYNMIGDGGLVVVPTTEGCHKLNAETVGYRTGTCDMFIYDAVDELVGPTSVNVQSVDDTSKSRLSGVFRCPNRIVLAVGDLVETFITCGTPTLKKGSIGKVCCIDPSMNWLDIQMFNDRGKEERIPKIYRLPTKECVGELLCADGRTYRRITVPVRHLRAVPLDKLKGLEFQKVCLLLKPSDHRFVFKDTAFFYNLLGSLRTLDDLTVSVEGLKPQVAREWVIRSIARAPQNSRRFCPFPRNDTLSRGLTGLAIGPERMLPRKGVLYLCLFFDLTGENGALIGIYRCSDDLISDERLRVYPSYTMCAVMEYAG